MKDINESRYYGKRSLHGKFDLKDKPGSCKSSSCVLKIPGLNKTGNVAIGYKKK